MKAPFLNFCFLRTAHWLPFLVFTLIYATELRAQSKQGPSIIREMRLVREVPSLAEQMRRGTLIEADQTIQGEINPKRRGSNRVVPGKGMPKDGDPLVERQKSITLKRTYQPEPLFVFDADNSQFAPSDPTGAVGPNHYVAGWNVAFRIFDKQGNALTPETSLGSLFEGNVAGDPIVLYDAAADRFIITEFEEENTTAGTENGFNIAISKGPDPVNDGWYIYAMGFETGSFPDYPKYSVWHDGYYITSNIPTTEAVSTGDAVFVMERDKMLVGDPSPGFLSFPLTGIEVNQFYSPQFFNVGNPDLPSGPATVVYMQDDSWQGVNADHLKLWTVTVDWNNPSSSAISQPIILATTPFDGVFDGGGFSNLPQPSGPDIDAMQAVIMNQAQFRKFDTHNSAVFNFVVDVLPGADERAGVRWYELRQTGDGQPWSIYQEGTYISPKNINTFGASMNIDKHGTIAMGYTTVSAQDRIAINYTGRYINDPPNIMSVPESLIKQGSGNSPTDRYADYTHLTLDPTDQETFWYISEYFNPGRKDIVGVFRLAPELTKDVQTVEILAPQEGVLSSSEPITVLIRNAGIETQGNFNVSYSVDGGTEVIETFTGSLAFNETAEFTFAQTADLSTEGKVYSITVRTRLSGDQNTSNDPLTREIQHIWSSDVGVSALVAPQSASGLSATEPVTIRVENFGGQAQSNFPVFYKVNDRATVTETFTGTIQSQTSAEFTFDQTADFSAIGTYTITAGTELSGDGDTTNDDFTRSIENSYCAPSSDCTNFDDGVTFIQLEGISVNTNCSSSGYTENLDVTFDLDIRASPFTGTLEVGYEDSDYAIFIDLNDNGDFEAEELVSFGRVAIANNPENFTLTLPAGSLTGLFRMRVRGSDSNEAGDVTNPCGNLDFGRTNDYQVRLFDSLIFPGSGLVIIETNNDQFLISLATTTTTEKMALSVYTVTGQKVVENWISSQNGAFIYELDMSFAATGIYIVRLGNREEDHAKKIIVK